MDPKSSKESNQHIQVFVRVRPLNVSERAEKSTNIIHCTGREVVVKERSFDKYTKKFTFDKVFGPLSKQLDVYTSVVNPMIAEVLAGYNCTVFAYGQTGTGKTFTMEGASNMDPTVSWEQDPLIGIIPRALSNLFDELRNLQAEYTVRVSFLELYNEELYDLLSATDDTCKIRLFEDPSKKGSVIVNGLEEVVVHSKNQVYHIMEKGSHKRQTAATLMNAQSSRSHTVFSITVHIKDNSVEGEELLKTGKLNLVDLAGSENIGRSGALDKRAREAGNINQSLLTLGRVITALVERAPHVPYRESKLTRLLQDSLGGRTKTSIIATVSPASINMEETLSTLDYAYRAKNITNRPEVNQKLTKKAVIKEYTDEIERLKKDLIAARERNGMYMDMDNYKHMVAMMEEQESDIALRVAEIKALVEQVDAKEKICSELNFKLEQCAHELEKTTENLKETQTQLDVTTQDRNEKEHLVQKHLETEHLLSSQAHSLLHVAEESSRDIQLLHEKLARVKSVESMNEKLSQEFLHSYQVNMSQLEAKGSTLTSEQQRFLQHFTATLESYLEHSTCQLAELAEHLASFLTTHGLEIQALESGHFSYVEASKTTLDQYVKDLDTKASSGAALLKNFIKDRLFPVLATVKKTIQQHLAENQKQHEMITSQVQALMGSMVGVTNLLSATAEKTKLLAVRQYASEKQLLEEFRATSHVSHQYDKQLTKDIQELLESYSTKKAKGLQEFQNKLSTVVEEGHDCSTNLLHNWDGLLEEVSLLSSTHKELSDKLVQNVVQLEQNESALQPLVADTEQLVAASHETECMATSQWFEHCRQGKDTLNKLSVDMDFTLQEQLKHTKNCALQAHELELAVSKDLGDQKTSIHKHVTSSQSVCKIHSEVILEGVEKMLTIVGQSQELGERFVMNELQQDVSSGLTPHRKDFHFPKTLAATSPHERILQRYRSSQTNAHLANIQDSVGSEGSDESLDEMTKPKYASTSDLLDKLPTAASICSSSEPDISSKECSTVKTKGKENQTLQEFTVPEPKRKPHEPSHKPAPCKKRILGLSN